MCLEIFGHDTEDRFLDGPHECIAMSLTKEMVGQRYDGYIVEGFYG